MTTLGAVPDAEDRHADLAHGVDGHGVDLVRGLGAGGADLHGVTGEVTEPSGGDLGAAGVMDADEQDARLGAVGGHDCSDAGKSRLRAARLT